MKTLVLLICAIILTTIGKAQTTTNTIRHTNSDVIQNGVETIETDWEGKQYAMSFSNGKLTALSVDGEKIPADKWSQYNKVIAAIREQIKKDEAQAEKDREQARKDRAQARLDRLQAEKDRQQGMKDREQAVLDRAQADKEREQAMKDHDLAQAEAKKDREQAEKDRAQAVRDRAQADKDREQAVKDRAQAEKDRAQAVLDRAQAERDRAQAAEDRKVMEELVTALISDKIIPSRDSLQTITITQSKMTVNGVVQPDGVYQQYKARFPRFSKGNFIYNHVGGNIQMGFQSTSLETEEPKEPAATNK